MKNKISVLLAEDHNLVRAGFRSLLEKIPTITRIWEACDGEETLQLAAEHQPDIVVLDITMPKVNGLLVAEKLKKEYPHIRIIIASMHGNEEYVNHALRIGASGYLLKDAECQDFRQAIEAAMRGEIFLSPSISKQVLSGLKNGNLGTVLTPRQKEILILMAQGRSTKEMAFDLCVSQKTIETHRLHLMKRLEIHDLAGLIRYALKKGWVSLDQ